MLKKTLKQPLSEPVFFYGFDTKAGRAGVAYSESPFRLISLYLPGNRTAAEYDGRYVHEDMAVTDAPPRKILDLCAHIAKYFEGGLSTSALWKNVGWEDLETGRLTDKEILVLKAVASIPYGETRSYKEVAAMAGSPNAYRFVGSTMAKNPFPVLIPCHRVIKSDGTAGGFGVGSLVNGTKLKEKMLALEGAYAERFMGQITIDELR